MRGLCSPHRLPDKPKAASEWCHQFSWHGHDPSGDSQQLARKRPHALRFEKLMLAPSSTYFDVENVRTADDALLTIRLMIFYKLQKSKAQTEPSALPLPHTAPIRLFQNRPLYNGLVIRVELRTLGCRSSLSVEQMMDATNDPIGIASCTQIYVFWPPLPTD